MINAEEAGDAFLDAKMEKPQYIAGGLTKDLMIFEAISLLLAGQKVRSAAWPNPKDHAYLSGEDDPEQNRLMLHRENVVGDRIFALSAVDLMADDWEVLR